MAAATGSDRLHAVQTRNHVCDNGDLPLSNPGCRRELREAVSGTRHDGTGLPPQLRGAIEVAAVKRERGGYTAAMAASMAASVRASSSAPCTAPTYQRASGSV